MKPDERQIEDVLQRALPSAPRAQMETSLDRIHARLQSERRVTAVVSDAHVEVLRRFDWPVSPKRVREGGWPPVMRTAAAGLIVAAAVWAGTSLQDQGMYAVLEAADGSTFRIADGDRIPLFVGDRIGPLETVRSDGAEGAILALSDGSRVEMRSASALTWDRAPDGLTVRLDTGSVIVDAATPPARRLYVQTKDMTASVAGTIALINAEEDGSRVAVIQGEARVREGTLETRLRSGEQRSTSPTLAARSVKDDIAWSRHAATHLAILASFQKGITNTAGQLEPLNQTAAIAQGGATATTSQVFEEAAVRPCDPDNLPALPAGARGGGANSFYMTPGRVYALCMTPATLIRTAYGYGPAELESRNAGARAPGLVAGNVYGLGREDGVRVRGGADWVRSESYTIEAVAAGAADASTLSGPMLRALLEERFKLKVHIDTEPIPAFALVVGPGGLKIKPVDAALPTPPISADEPGRLVVMAGGGAVGGPVNKQALDSGACEPPPPIKPGVPLVFRPRHFSDVRQGARPTCGVSMQVNGPNQVVVGGAAAMAELGRSLAGALGNVQVFDKTGVTGLFNFIFEFGRDENTPGRRRVVTEPGAQGDVPRAASIFTALEEQLGLRLEAAVAPREFIVIDAIERPAAN